MVQKFKIIGKTVELTILETDKDGSREAATITKHALVHPDLQRALDLLRVHWGLMFDYIDPKSVKNIAAPDEKLVEKVHVYGYAYSGGDDGDAALSILGRRTTMGGHSFSAASHAWHLEGNPDARYLHMAELVRIMKLVEAEVDAYLDGSKRGKDTDGGEKATAPKKEKVTHALVAKPEPQVTTTAIGAKLPRADPAAQARVQEWSAEEYSEEVKKTGKRQAKKQPQSPDNPAGA